MMPMAIIEPRLMTPLARHAAAADAAIFHDARDAISPIAAAAIRRVLSVRPFARCHCRHRQQAPRLRRRRHHAALISAIFAMRCGTFVAQCWLYAAGDAAAHYATPMRRLFTHAISFRLPTPPLIA